jgi:hypothetical protein
VKCLEEQKHAAAKKEAIQTCFDKTSTKQYSKFVYLGLENFMVAVDRQS